MAIVLKDRVKEAAPAPGTGTIALAGAATGFQAFSAIGSGNVTYFAITDIASGAWEVNYGTYTAAGTTLSRNATPLSSSNAGALVNFTNAVEVFCTYPSEKAIYEETSGNVLIDGGPITVLGSGVTTYTSLSAALGELYANVNAFAQFYAQNQSSGSDASTDFVVENNLGTDTQHYADFGINSSNYTSVSYPIYTPNSGYIYSIGDGGTNRSTMFLGSGDGNVVIHAGGFATTDQAITIDRTTKLVSTIDGASVGGALAVTGAASFSSTVALSTNPTTALQAATKQYVDEQVTAGIHIHAPVLVETTGNLTASYTQGGTTFNITDITGGNTVTTSTTHGLSVNDQIWLYSTAGNGLSINTAYFVYSTPAGNQLTLSLTFGGAQITGLTNATGLTYATRGNSGVGALLTNSGTQAALVVDNVTLAVGNRVMVRLQTNGAENGVYVVNDIGSISTNWVLERATDANKVSPADPNGLSTGDYFYTQDGDTNAGDSHVLTTEPNTMIIGYTPLTYTQFSGSVVYTGVAPIDVTGQLISLTGTVAATNGGTGTNTVTTGDLLYGSATNTWSKLPLGAGYKSLVVNAGGTQVEWNAVALNQSGAVSGALPELNGGTNQTSYVLGDTLYSSAANTLAKLSGNTTTTKKFLTQTGTGAVSSAPVWDTVSGADVNGNIAGQAGSVANALTAGTYLTSGGTYDGSVARTFTVDATSANTVSKVVARDASGNFSAGTITAALTGNATTATTSTNVAGGAANQIIYNTAASTTGYATAPTTSGQVLGWNGSAFSWVTTIASATTATNVSGGTVSATTGTFSTTVTLNNGLADGAGIVFKSLGFADWEIDSSSGNLRFFQPGNVYGTWTTSGLTVTGTVTATTFAGTATRATNIAGGAASQIPYQTGVGTTGFIANGTSGQFLQSNGASVPTWVAAPGAQAGGVIYENSLVISANYTLTTAKNGMSVGPITINSGVSVTVPSGQRWLVF